MNVPLESLPLFLEWIRKSCFSSSLSAVAELHCSSAGVRLPPPHISGEAAAVPWLLLVLFLCLWFLVTGAVQVGRRGPCEQPGRQEGCAACRMAGEAEA